jgi:predicted PurR-regulated permease PerM
MGFDKIKIKQICQLMILAAVLVLCIMHSDYLIGKIWFVIGILSTFAAGVAIAFVINIPMSFFERKLFGRSKRLKKAARPLSLVLALLTIIAVIILITSTVIPQLVKTITDLAYSMPQYLTTLLHKLENIFAKYPWVLEQLQKINLQKLDWIQMSQNMLGFLRSGFGTALNGTFAAAGKFVNAIVNAVIAFIFALYVIIQKETLIDQSKRILCAYIPLRAYVWIRKTVKLLQKNCKNFITGQCTEAVIIGLLFLTALTVLRIPYALLIAVLLAFTSLIPIVGTFVGFIISLLLVLMVSPVKALIFAIAFIVIQQIEGNLIYPRVVGGSVGLPAIWVLAAVSIGSSLMGILGMLTFIPIMATVYSLIRDDVNARNHKRKI